MAEDDPVAMPAHEEVRPERKILRLPKAVSYRRIDAAKHEYTISAITPRPTGSKGIHQGRVGEDSSLPCDVRAPAAWC